VELVEERRREYALSSLENLVANERVRLEEEEEEAKREVENKKESEGGNDEGKQAGDGGKAEKQSPEAVPGAEAKKQSEGQDEDEGDKKIPPPAEKLFELLYDEIEHRDITYIGVAPDNPLFVRGMELLRIHTAREIREGECARERKRGRPTPFSCLPSATFITQPLVTQTTYYKPVWAIYFLSLPWGDHSVRSHRQDQTGARAENGLLDALRCCQYSQRSSACRCSAVRLPSCNLRHPKLARSTSFRMATRCKSVHALPRTKCGSTCGQGHPVPRSNQPLANPPSQLLYITM
jgi:hypothetical protein